MTFSQEAAAPATTPTPKTTGLSLKAPSAPPLLDNDAVANDVVAPGGTLVPISEEKREHASQEAEKFVTSLLELDTKSPSFMSAVKQVQNVATEQVLKTSRMSTRMLERPIHNLASFDGKGKPDVGSPQQRVAKDLVDLRIQVDELRPNMQDLSPTSKFIQFFKRSRVANYFKKYEDAQSQLNAITKSLEVGRDELRRDNAAIEIELSQMWQVMGELAEGIILVSSAGSIMESRIDEIGLTDPERAKHLKSDALFPINQKHQDLVTSLGVAVQGYLSLQMIIKNNDELAKGIDRAETVTLSALRTAIVIHQALTNQELVLNQIEMLNATTSSILTQNSQMLHHQGVRIHQQAVESGVQSEALIEAFDQVFATMDEIDNFRSEAAISFRKTITDIETKIADSKPYLERAGQARAIEN